MKLLLCLTLVLAFSCSDNESKSNSSRTETDPQVSSVKSLSQMKKFVKNATCTEASLNPFYEQDIASNIKFANVGCLKYDLENGANPNKLVEDRFDMVHPIFIALDSMSFTEFGAEILYTLLENGADISAVNDDGNNVLQALLLLDQFGIEKVKKINITGNYLFSKNFDFNELDSGSLNSLQRAIHGNLFELADISLSKGTKFNLEQSENVPMLALSNFNKPFFKKLIKSEQINKSTEYSANQDLLQKAILFQNDEAIKLLLSESYFAKNHIDDSGENALITALKALDRESLVIEIANRGFSQKEKTKREENVLHLASNKNFLKLMTMFTSQNPELLSQYDSQENNFVHYFVKNDQVKFASMAIEHNRDFINEKNSSGQTPLFLSKSDKSQTLLLKNQANPNIKYGKISLLQHLIRVGSESRALEVLKYNYRGSGFKDSLGRNYLHLSLGQNMNDLAKSVSKFVDIFALTKNDESALFFTNDLEMLKFLINSGVNPNQQNGVNQTALHKLLTIEQSFNFETAQVVNFLVDQASTDLNLETITGETAIFAAVERAHQLNKRGLKLNYNSLESIFSKLANSVTKQNRDFGNTAIFYTRDLKATSILKNLGFDLDLKNKRGSSFREIISSELLLVQSEIEKLKNNGDTNSQTLLLLNKRENDLVQIKLL